MLIIVTVVHFWYSEAIPAGVGVVLEGMRSPLALANLHYARSGKLVGVMFGLDNLDIYDPQSAFCTQHLAGSRKIEREGWMRLIQNSRHLFGYEQCVF